MVAPLDEAAGAGIVVIPGAEIGVAWPQAALAEVCAIGIREVRRKHVHPQEVIDDVLDQGGIPFISHPHMSGVYSSLMMDLEGLVGIEIFNAACQHSGRRGVSTTHWDDLLTCGRRVWGWACDDRHTDDEYPPPPGCLPYRDHAKGWIMVRAPRRSEEAILQAIRDGHFYSTTGPTIHDIRVEEGMIHVRCSEAKQITFASVPWTGTRVHAEPGGSLTEASVSTGAVGEPSRIMGTIANSANLGDHPRPKKMGSYFRVEIWDGEDGYAWSNPHWFGTASWTPDEA